MPAEPTTAKLKRRASRKDAPDEFRFDGGHAREIEQKRSRGEISCAECRRLKIKCDKTIPCQSCQRRGCAALCPNGSLATGQGTRFVLAATEHLHRRIARLSGRIRQLEDALAALQAKHTNEPHPLLHEDLLSASNEERDDDGAAPADEAAPPSAPDAIDAFGTLSISDHGISRFFGPTGGSESLLMANSSTGASTPDASPTPDSLRSSMSPASAGDLALFSHAFPFTPLGSAADVQEMIESHLPPLARARALCGTYFAEVAWIFRGVTRAQLVDDMLPVIYRTAPPAPGEDYSGPHDLALLFVVLAIGALVEDAPAPALAEHFHHVARAALCLQPVLERPALVTLQALHLMSVYNAMSGGDAGNETSMEMTWSLITLAAHLAQTIGLHRDSARWGLSRKMVYRRRLLFWDLFVADTWQSLNTGRPPSFSLAYIDCSFPDDGTPDSASPAASPSFESWGFRFAAECVADVAARTLTAEAPSYTTIMELDRKVREFPLPATLPGDGAATLASSFERCVLDHIRETILLYIHRSFFAQAIIEQPANPLKSAYAPSFLAAYRASATILKSVRDQYAQWPQAAPKYWQMWTFAFSAAIVFGTVVTRGPRSPLASSAMAELDQACLLFTKAANSSRRAARALPILVKLSDKAHAALAHAAAQPDPTPTPTPPLPAADGLLWGVPGTDDELAIFAGRTRFVSSARPAAPAPRAPSPAPPPRHAHPAPPPPQQQPQQADPQAFAPRQMAWAPAPAPAGYLPPPAHEQFAHAHAHAFAAGPGAGPSATGAGAQAGYGWDPRGYAPAPAGYAGEYTPGPPHAHVQGPGAQAYYPAFGGAGSSSALADLGIAARDSRLDERWRLFMEDSGLL